MASSKLGLLRRVSFFSEMSERDLRQIDGITSERRYEAGELIIQEHAAGERFFIVCQGKIQILKRFEDGEELLLAVLSDGEFFGEMALLDEGSRSASVRASEATTVLEISRRDFETLLYKAPLLAYSIMKELSSRLRETGALLVSHLQRKNRELAKAYLDTVSAVMQVLEAREGYAPGHTARVTGIAREVGRELGLAGDELFNLEIGALLHDVGKVVLPGELPGQPGPPKAEEQRLLQEQASKGRQVLQGLPHLRTVLPELLYHHEPFDGTGYPDKLSGADLPLPGRIVYLADSFDALLSDRPSRPRLSLAEALRLIREGAGNRYDPRVVEAFLRVIERPPLREQYPRP